MKVLLAIVIAGGAWAQVADKANTNYRTPEGREGMARVLGSPERAERLKADAMIAALKIEPGSVVADVGTGVGVMLPSLSAAVGAGGKIIAEDVFPDFLAKAREAAERAKLGNVTFLRGTEKSPNLPAGCCDLVVTVDVYHHFDYPAEMLAGIRAALRSGGRFAIVDYYRRKGAMDNGDALEHIRIDAEDVVKEVESNGFRLITRAEHVPGKQYIEIFEKR